MKKMMFLLLPILLLLNACEEGNLGNEPFENSREVTVYGKVTDKENVVIQGARVHLSGRETYTNNLGLYVFEDIVLEEAGEFLKVTAEEYFTGGKIVRVRDNSANKLNVKLLQKENGGNFNSSNGGELNLGDTEAKILFNANGIVDENNETYTGNVEVYYTLIKTDDNDFETITPGGLSAINSDNEEVILASYGMLGVELLGTGGERLNLGNGQTATITIPLAAEQLSSAPSSIPLWHLNEETGFWEEEGQATLQGDKYIGEVSHFSFWNCDVPSSVVELTFQVVDQDNVPAVNVYVNASINEGGSISGGTTDDNGFVMGYFPKDEMIDLSMGIDMNCNLVGYELDTEIGSFQEDTNLGVISATRVEGWISDITGVIETNCETENEGSYFLVIQDESSNCSWEYFLTENNFNIQFPGSDGGNYTVAIYDMNNSLSSQTYDIVEGENNLGIITTCETVDQYIELEVNGEQYSSIPIGELFFLDMNAPIAHPSPTITVGEFSVYMMIYYDDENDKLNSSTLSSLIIQDDTQNIYLNCDGYGPGSNHECNEILELTEFGDVGGYLEGTASGDLYNNVDGEIIPCSLKFRLKLH